jgi:hypothetical protein
MAKLAALAPIFTAGAGIFSAVKSIQQSSQKPPTPQPLPQAPKPEDAAAKAAEEVKKKQRRTAAAATDITRGSALVPNINIQQKSLLGA